MNDGRVSIYIDFESKPQLLKYCFTAIWGNGLQPGQLFDAENPSPLLLKYINEGKIPNGRALVPGFGRGYDMTALASAERSVVGFEIAPTAVQAAQDRLSSLSRDECAYPGNVDFRLQSFFDYNAESLENKFDFVYDYTFLCALDPSIRNDWANKMSEIVKPGGILLTLIFPIVEKVGGPPFAVSLQLLKDLLVPVGFECLELDMLSPELCHPRRDGSPGSLGASGVGLWKRV